MQTPDRFPCSGGPAASGCMPNGGFLMQQIVGAGRLCLRYERFTLPIGGLPPQAAPPFRLTQVEANGNALSGQLLDCGCRAPAIQVDLPLCCQVTDSEGCRYQTASSLSLTVPLRLCSRRELDRAQTFVNACVRLARPCNSACGEAIDAWLDGSVEVWLTACRPVWNGECPPSCCQAPYPPLPLYPPPCRPR
ncbi:MAG: hypothetical protein IJS53_02125 [Clostridia bacterium]|nr:hypothetical protein [Clostridia bacterium]